MFGGLVFRGGVYHDYSMVCFCAEVQLTMDCQYIVNSGHFLEEKVHPLQKSFVKDGATGTSNRQLGSTSQERDFWRWMKLPVDAYCVDLPLYSRHSIHKQVVLEKVSVLLMSDMLNYVFTLGKELGILLAHPDSLRSWWENEHDNIYLQELGLSKSELIEQHYIPLVFHEDGVPNWHDSTAAFWSWSCPCSAVADAMTNRFAIVGVETALLTPEARRISRILAKVIGWDLESLRSGVYATCNHEGAQFADGSLRSRRGGAPMRAKAVFAFWKGDAEAHVKSHFLERHYGARMICDWCAALRTAAVPYADFRSTALWRRTCDYEGDTRQHEASPWLSVRGYRKRRRCFDLMHLCHLGFIRDVIGGVLRDTLQTGVLAHANSIVFKPKAGVNLYTDK